MNFLLLWMLLVAIVKCSEEKYWKMIKGRTSIDKKWIILQWDRGDFVCSSSSSFYLSSKVKDGCRWKVIKSWRGYLLKNSYGKYLSGNKEFSSPQLSSLSESFALWRISNSASHLGAQWELKNIHYSLYLGRLERRPILRKYFRNTKNGFWKFYLYEDQPSDHIKFDSKSKTCLRGVNGSYLTIASDGNKMKGSRVCDSRAQWYVKRTFDGHYTVYNSYFKKYLVSDGGSTNKVSPSSNNGKWSFYSYSKGFLIKSGDNYFMTLTGYQQPWNIEKITREAMWTLEAPKNDKKEKISLLNPKKYNVALYYEPKKKYLSSFMSECDLSKKNIDSLWVAVPEGKKAGKHYLVNFEGKYLTARSASITFSSSKTNEGLWKIEEITKNHWIIKNIRSGLYLDYYRYKVRISHKSTPEWRVYDFTFNDNLSYKFSKPLSFYNAKTKTYLSLNSGVPQMGTETFPWKLKKQGVFYFIEHNGKYLSFSSNSVSPYLSPTNSSDSLFKIHRIDNVYYEFISFGHKGSKLGVTSSGQLKASFGYGREVQWELPTFKNPLKPVKPLPKPVKPLPKPVKPLPKPVKPLPKPVNTLPKTFKGKVATFRTPNGKYLGANKDKKKIVLTTVLYDSYWRVEQKEKGIFYIISPFKTYLSRGRKGLYQSETPKDGSKWKIIIKGTKWAIKSAINYKYISVKNEKFLIFTNIIYYWNFEAATTKNSITTGYVEDPKDYFGSELYIQSESNMFLKYEDNKIRASDDEDSLWKITNAANGMFYVSTKDNYYLHSAKKGQKAVLKKHLSDKAKWKIEIKNDKWKIKSNRYGTYLSLNEKNELVCAKKQYQWQVGAISLTIIDRNIFVQDKKSKLFLGQDFGEVKMLSQPTSDAYIMLSRKKANIVSLADSWNNYFIESNKEISSTYDLTNEGLWFLQEKKKGTVFKNKVSGRYLYYNSKGKLTTTSNQEKALWTIYLA